MEEPTLKQQIMGNYCGLTIVMSNPSRHDTKKLLSGNAGDFFWSNLAPFLREQCDIVLAKDWAEYKLQPNIKVIFALGEEAAKMFDQNNSLNEIRGCPFRNNPAGPVIICSYQPQDAFDRKDYDAVEDDVDKEDRDDAGKTHGNTQRKNWKFWLYHDIRKVVNILNRGLINSLLYHQINYPNSGELILRLSSIRGSYLYLDIETDKKYNITALGFTSGAKRIITIDNKEYEYPEQSFMSSDVVVFPIKHWNEKLAYSTEITRTILQALVRCMHLQNNTTVIHNSMFDLFILAWKYKIPFPRHLVDTMIMWHRCYPEVEKSLGHLISYFLHEAYHKSEGVYAPHNAEQQAKLFSYNAKDVIRLKAIHYHLAQEAIRIGTYTSGLRGSRYVRQYLMMTLRGMRLDTEKLVKRYNNLEFHAKQLTRCLKVVTKQDINPRSSQQVSSYLYEQLGLECPNEEKPTDKKTLLKLLTKTKVPSVQIILAIRAKRKAASALKFKLWGKNNDRFTTVYSVTGTDTYRLGSRALLKFKPDPGYGSNGQNWAKEQRDLIIPD